MGITLDASSDCDLSAFPGSAKDVLLGTRDETVAGAVQDHAYVLFVCMCAFLVFCFFCVLLWSSALRSAETVRRCLVCLLFVLFLFPTLVLIS